MLTRISHLSESIQIPAARVLTLGTFSWPMWFLKKLRVLFLLSLSLGLFGSELCESFRLADDVSNDLVQVSVGRIHKSVETASQDLIPQRCIVVAEELVLDLAGLPSVEPAPSSGSDLLRLISIQRK